MVIGGFSPAGSSVAFGRGLSAQFDPLDLDPLRQVLATEIDFASLREPTCPKLLIATTRVRDGSLQIFRNKDLTADVVLASTCPPLIHCAVEIEGEAYWDGGFAANPPVVQLVQASEATDVLVVQITPTRDAYIPMTLAAIDRRIDQITANSTLNAEIAALDMARDNAATPKLHALRLFRIAAEDTVDGLAQRSAVDLGPGLYHHAVPQRPRCRRSLAVARSGRRCVSRPGTTGTQRQVRRVRLSADADGNGIIRPQRVARLRSPRPTTRSPTACA